MEITPSNALIGISLIGGIAHLMVYMNGLWSNPFWITAIGIVLIPLIIKKQRILKKKNRFRIANSKKKAKIEQNDLLVKVKGNCKICGASVDEAGMDFCSQKCSFEDYLNRQSKNSSIEENSKLFTTKQEFTYI
jgi:endogenous inhibitor of DNA gyrase (YacG/DUF329 family)